MQPLTLPEIRLIEKFIREGLPMPPTSYDIDLIKRALKMALETNEVLRHEWAKADNKTVV